ncbi:bifunctional folylpolyglutamate synthase/dihydrofolate synthase [Candidatus Omnitrophota bacterium]
MDYNTTLNYIDSFVNFEDIPRYDYASSFRLERMHSFLQELGDPHKVLRVIHIAGSKGKGSTCSIIASILRQAGYRVGLYTSPHLLDVRERIRVLVRGPRWETERSGEFEGVIKKDEFIKLIEKIKPVAERFRDHKELGRLSFFEILTASAFLYFKEKKVDVSVMETGLGGRLDATNVTEPIVCGITNISLEHTDKLGDSLESIAKEKAGIIKAHGIMVSSAQEKVVRDVIRDVCKEKKVRLYEIGKDVRYKIIESDIDKEIFDIKGPDFSCNDLEINLIGEHQAENATLGVAITKLIDKGILRIDEEDIRAGIKNVFWPGRLQVIRYNPYIILDGAHNVSSIRVVLASIKRIFNYKRLICIFGASSDKDTEGVSKELEAASSIVILTKSKNVRAKEVSDLKKNFSIASLIISNNVEKALKHGLEILDTEDLLLVTGSLFVVGEAMKALEYTWVA